jgi:dTDP-4-dehydrorhamnose reductase
MKVLVTGRSGQLARSLAERVTACELIAVGRPELDLEIPGSADAAIRRIGPDVVINTAAYTDVDRAEDEPDRAFQINAEGAREVAAACAALGVPIIQISTDYVFDGSLSGTYAEDAPVAPLGIYGRSKLAGEEQVRAANPRHMILRTAWVYSSFGRNFVKTMFDAAATRDELRVVADQRGSPTSALDLADALVQLAARWDERGATYHLACAGEASWYELACEVMRCRERIGLPVARIEPIATSDWPTTAKRPPNSVLNSAKLERDFGFQLPDWRTSVAKVVERLAVAQ